MNPRSVTYHQKSKTLELEYADGERSILSAELLRVYSPSAEVRGHSSDQRQLQSGKRDVAIDRLESIGNYAIRIVFNDGHDTGIYSWSYLRDLHDNRDQYWTEYLNELEQANASRLPTIPVGQWTPQDDT